MTRTSSFPEIRTAPKARVLLADDHPDILATAAKILEKECVVVGTTHDGSQLISAVQQMNPDLVVLDISMPKIDGLEAARHIHHLHPTIALIFLTVLDDPDYVRAALDSGALGYVVKSRIATDLLPAVRAARLGQQYLSQSIHS